MRRRCLWEAGLLGQTALRNPISLPSLTATRIRNLTRGGP